jgi:hypothetical protein
VIARGSAACDRTSTPARSLAVAAVVVSHDGLRATLAAVTDDELADAWEAGAVFPGGVSHLEHLRIAWVLHRRHGPEEARRRLVSGTERACEAHGCPEKFDAALTERWVRAIAEAARRDGLGPTAASFIAAHPQLQRGDLFGSPDRPG